MGKRGGGGGERRMNGSSPSVGIGKGRWRRNKRKQQQGKGKGMTKMISTLSKSIAAVNSFLHRHDLNLLPSQTMSLLSLLSSINSLLPSPSNHVLPPPPSPSWLLRFLSSPQHPALWSDAFHMSQPSFHLLLSALSPSLHRSIPSTPPLHALASSLLRLAHALPLSPLAASWFFSATPADLCLVFYTVCRSIMERLRFSSDETRILSGFERMSLPNCCGVVGVRCFPVKDGGGVTALTVVDSEKRFVEASVGWPGHVRGDLMARRWRMVGEEGGRRGCYLLCDEEMSCPPWLVPPSVQGGEVHGAGMEVGGMAMGMVCGRWRILSREWSSGCADSLPYVVVACCLLHNFLIDHES